MKNLLLNSIKKVRYYFLYIKVVLYLAKMFFLWKINPQPKNKVIRRKTSIDIIDLLHSNIKTTGELDNSCGLILVNHSSLFDIPLIESFYEKDICWVGKSQLNFPIVRYLMSHPNHIVVDRSSKTSMIGMIKKSKEMIKQDRPIVIFPEGTRNTKENLLPFKDGAKALAQTLELKIQPIVITGINQILDHKNHYLHYSKSINVHFLPSIKVSKKQDDNWYKDLYNKMNAIYRQGINK